MVLVVDDNPDACHMLARLVRYLKGEAACALSGEEALQLVEKQKPDLMILDMMMPGMDGLDVLRRLRSDPRTQEIPVVMFSAMSDPAFRLEALQNGANDYWVKASWDFAKLAQHLQNFIPPHAPQSAAVAAKSA